MDTLVKARDTEATKRKSSEVANLASAYAREQGFPDDDEDDPPAWQEDAQEPQGQEAGYSSSARVRHSIHNPLRMRNPRGS